MNMNNRIDYLEKKLIELEKNNMSICLLFGTFFLIYVYFT